MNKKKIAIIGSGPGGYTCALKLNKLGHDVFLIEKNKLGGTCLNVGCIPTKTLLDQLSIYESFLDAKKKNIFSAENININSLGLIQFQNTIISQLSQGINSLFKKQGIELISGIAKFKDEKTLIINDENELSFDEIIIATGSKPKSIPGFKFDGKSILSSDDVWNIPSIPQKLLVIGSGPIGIEFARVFYHLGSAVTIVEIQDSICPILDIEISENLERSLKRRKIKILKSYATKLIDISNSKVKVEFLSTKEDKNMTEEFDQILIATGREPNIKELCLEKAGVEIDAGFIRVDRYLKTSKNNIWAIGDVTNFPQLAHTASTQGKIVAENINLGKMEFDHKNIPGCIYGYPEVSFVGYTEEELKKNNIKYKVGRSLYLANGKAKASGHTEGLVKVLIDDYSEEILGAHIIGAESPSIIHEFVVSIKNSLTVEDMISSIHAHPTYSEIALEALENSIGEGLH